MRKEKGKPFLNASQIDKSYGCSLEDCLYAK